MAKFIHWNKEYICVKYDGEKNWYNHDGSKKSFGGSQMWMHSGDVFKWHHIFKREKILMDSGCGLISGGDILLYLAKCNEKFRTPFTNVVLEPDESVMDYNRYMAYMDLMNDNYFPINTIFGITGFSMAKGINRYCRKHKMPVRAHWCASRKKMLPRIIKMLEDGIPVTLSIGPMGKYGVTFYDWVPKNNNHYNFECNFHKDLVDGHYVTITGYMYDEVKDRHMLEISSWGRKYYIDFDEYVTTVKKHSNFLFSNILYISSK